MRVSQVNPLLQCAECGSILLMVGPSTLEHLQNAGECPNGGKQFGFPTFDLNEIQQEKEDRRNG